MKKTIFNLSLVFFAAGMLLSCADEVKSLKDEEMNTFRVNGVSCAEGHEKISKSLTADGFKKGGNEGECDLNRFDEGVIHYDTYTAEKLTPKQVTKLMGGLFDNLPSGKKAYTVTGGGAQVFLSWDNKGNVQEAFIDLGGFEPMPEEDVKEVEKRLAAMFKTSEVTDEKNGYRTYYDEGGVALYFPKRYFVRLFKAQKLKGMDVLEGTIW